METSELSLYRKLLAEAAAAFPSLAAAREAVTFDEGEVFKHASVRCNGALHHYRFIKGRDGETTAILDRVVEGYHVTEARRSMTPDYLCSAETALICTPNQAALIQRELDGAESEDLHGFEFRYEESTGTGLLLATENGCPENLPDKACALIGELLTENNLPWLTVGCALTAGNNFFEGSHGGSQFRIYPDGDLQYEITRWPEAQEQKDCHSENQSGDTQLGYWEWVRHEIEAEEEDRLQEASDGERGAV
jgi:hypothetical protein